MTDLFESDLAARFGDSVEVAIQERHDAPEGLPRNVRRKATKVARAQVWDASANIRGVLGPGKALTAEEICRQTGQSPEIVGGTLAIMEGKGEVRRVDGKWQHAAA